MRESIIFAGFGGQGIMFMGKLLAYSAMHSGLEVTWMPSYGAEVRGGTAHSMVIISDKPIASTVIKDATSAIVMNQPSMDKFKSRIKKGGVLVANTSMVDDKGGSIDGIKVAGIDATDEAVAMGDVRVANMIALGTYLEVHQIIDFDKVCDSLKSVLSPRKQNLLKINEDALKRGRELAKANG